VPSLVLGVGYIGAALVERLCASGEEVVGVENGFATDWGALHQLAERWAGRFRLIHGDVRDPETLDRAFTVASPIEAVYLMAAQASAHADAARAEYTEETNLRAPRLVLEAVLRHGKPPVAFGSSFHVYGAPLVGDVNEARPYGALRDLSHLSKVYAEKLGELYAREHGVAFSPVRLGIVYGLGPIVKRDIRFLTVPHAFCVRIVRGEPLVVNRSGLVHMGFIHLDDAVEALLAARAQGGDGGYAPANAVGEVLTVVDVLEAVSKAAHEIGIVVRAEAPVASSATSEKAREAFTVSTRLSAIGWHARRRLYAAAGQLLAHHATVESVAA